jgi:hypothetical protein
LRIKRGKEIYKRFIFSDVVTVFLVGILKWYGFVVRMDGTLQGL